MDTAEGTFSASPCCLFYRPNKAETGRQQRLERRLGDAGSRLEWAKSKIRRRAGVIQW